jgi:hypothetical protein
MARLSFLQHRRAQRMEQTFPYQAGVVASAATLNLASRSEARRVRMLRQGWQEDAMAYADAIGEIQFAHLFIRNCASRMRIYPAAYPVGTFDAEPVPIDDPAAAMPPQVIVAANAAMAALGSGRVAMANLMGMLSWNFSVVGEAFLHGATNPGSGIETWTLRSIDEMMVRDDQYWLREVPLDPQGVFGWVQLDPELNYVARLWTPHPRFKLLATSSMRGILDSAEELMILSRAMRGAARSRLAGVLKVPNGLEAFSPTDDNPDPQASPFMGVFANAMMAPIADEGVASAVVPIVVRGEIEALNALQHISMDRPLDPIMAAQRQELIGRIATGLDLPKEVLLGISDLNHWSAWAVDDNSFRHHIEPHVVNCVDALTVGYLRMALAIEGIDPALIARIVCWYDPTELLTHPDRTQDALALYGLKEISGETLRRVTGFNEDDKPSDIEVVQRLISAERTWPPNAALAILARLDPSLSFPAITTAGTFPGIKAGGIEEAAPLPLVPGSTPGTPALAGLPPSPSAGAPSVEPNTTPPPPAGPPKGPGGITASASNAARLSRRLQTIDADLRTRLQVAANAAVARVLDRAGAKLRTSVKRDARLSRAISEVDNRHVAHQLGQGVVEALGVSAPELLTTDWSDLAVSYRAWTQSAILATVSAASQIVSDAPDSVAALKLRAKLEAQAQAAWRVLETAVAARTAQLLYQPDPTLDQPYGNAVSPDSLVPASMTRAVLAVIGGTATVGAISQMANGTAPASEPMGQIGTGDAVASYLTDQGAEQAGYEWVHGSPMQPFEPHEDLDGYQFTDWDDDGLANTGDWPDGDYFFPGDHQGDTCDAMVLWEPGETGVESDGGDITMNDVGHEPVIRDSAGNVVIPAGSREPGPQYPIGQGPEG